MLIGIGDGYRVEGRYELAERLVREAQVESAGTQSRGLDLISRRPYPEDRQTSTEARSIEVKERAGGVEIAWLRSE